MRITLSLLILLSSMLSSLALSQSATEIAANEAAIRQLVQQYLDTREQNDEQALRALLTDDVDQLTTSGNLRSGRNAVSSGSLATSQDTGGSRSITVESIRFLGTDVAIVDGPYDNVGRSDGPDTHYHTSIVVVLENGTWLIAAIRNMQPTQ